MSREPHHKIDTYTAVMPDPEEGLSKRVAAIRRELLRSETPLTTAAIEIAKLRAKLARLEAPLKATKEAADDLISPEALQWARPT